MRRITRLALTAVASVGLLACRSAPRAASSSTDGQCRAEVENADLRGWREVRGAGFTYCVPGNWETSGRIAHRGANRVEWNVGMPIRPQDARPLGTAEVINAYDNTVRVRGNPAKSLLVREPIDGRPVDLYREPTYVPTTQGAAMFMTGAQWLGPTIHFVGQAAELPATEVQFTIYRTVRFDRT